jgi:serine phosphatase RsbU (regulator of sigma subunit)
MGKIFFLFLIILVSGFPINPNAKNAEIGIPFIRNFTPDEYNAETQNWSIAQNKQGIIFIGNNSGVLEYDGTYWRLIECANHSSVRSLAIDTHDVIYVGGISEFGYLKPDPTGKLIYQSLVHLLPADQCDFTDIWKTFVGQNGIYFNASKKIFRYDGQKISVLAIPYNQRLMYVNHRLISFDFTGEIHEIDEKTFTLRPLASTKIAGAAYYCQYDDHSFLMFYQQLGIFRFDFSLGISPFQSETNDWLKKNFIYAAIRLHNGDYAIGTMRQGLLIMSPTGELRRIISRNHGLQDDCILSIFEDHNGNLWLALNSGVSYIELNSPVTIFNEHNNLKGSPMCVTRHLHQLYVGTFNNGILTLPPNQSQLQDDHQRFHSVGDPREYCWEFISVNNHLLMVGKEVVVISKKGVHAVIGPWSMYSAAQSKRFPQYLFLGHSEVTGGGLGLLEIKKGKGNSVEYIPHGKMAGITEIIKRVRVDCNGDLWLSTLQELLIFIHFKNSLVTDYKVLRFSQSSGLSDSGSNNACLIDNEIIVCTNKGIMRPVYENGLPVRFIPDPRWGKDLSSGAIGVLNMYGYGINQYLVQLIQEGRVKIGLIKKNANSINLFTQPFTLIKSKNNNPLFIDEDRMVWIPSDKGLFRYDPSLPKNYQETFTALIREIMVANQRIVFSGQVPDLINNLEFSYQENTISFTFSAPFYEHGHETLYSYCLEHFDKKWSDWTKKTEKEYTNLPEGSYCFKVKAKNIYEFESTPGSFSFSVRPPWQRSIFAYMGYTLFFLLLMFIGIRLNNRRLINAKIKLEKIVSERTSALITKNKKIIAQKDEISKQKDEIELYVAELHTTNFQLTETKNALWGEMELAKKIQTVLLPKEPIIPGYEISVFMQPADEVGGDYYDVIEIKEEPSILYPLTSTFLPSYWLSIGDVSGHGVPAGLVMMMVQTAIRQALDRNSAASPKDVLASVNRVIHENIKKLGEDKYMTITLMSVQPDGKILYSGLHQDIFIYRILTKTVESIETTGMWIGMTDNIHEMLNVKQFILNPGDVILLYTDGITEAVDRENNMFSENKLKYLLEKFGNNQPKEIKNHILDALNDYTLNDDVTLLILKKST